MKDNIHIAIVDDGINEQYYKDCNLEFNIEITNDLTIKKRDLYNKKEFSHGSVCAAIIHKYAPHACIGSVKILNENRETEINRLIKAIEWCINKNDIDIINLSLGTVYFNDFIKLAPIIKKAISQGITIVAASSNSGHMTYPAYITDVIGVKCDKMKILKEGEYIYHYFPNDGVNVTAYSNILIQTSTEGNKYTGFHNSYAAAFITSKVYNILSKDTNIMLQDINNKLISDSINDNKNFGLMKIKKEVDWIKNAIVFIYNENIPDCITDSINLLQFNIVDVVYLEYKSQKKIINDIQNCLSKQMGDIDTIIIDANEIELKNHNYCTSNIISELLKLNKNIVYLDDREINNKLTLKLINSDNKIWHPSIVKFLDFTDYKKSDIPIITIHDLTNRYIFKSIYKIQEFFRKDGYNITSIVDQCYGKLFGFEFIPLYDVTIKPMCEDVLGYISGFCNSDILLFGSCVIYDYVNLINKIIKIDISIVITDNFAMDTINFFNTESNRIFILISSVKVPEILCDRSDIKIFDISILDKLYELYQYIICLYNAT